MPDHILPWNHSHHQWSTRRIADRSCTCSKASSGRKSSTTDQGSSSTPPETLTIQPRRARTNDAWESTLLGTSNEAPRSNDSSIRNFSGQSVAVNMSRFEISAATTDMSTQFRSWPKTGYSSTSCEKFSVMLTAHCSATGLGRPATVRLPCASKKLSSVIVFSPGPRICQACRSGEWSSGS